MYITKYKTGVLRVKELAKKKKKKKKRKKNCQSFLGQLDKSFLVI